MINIGGKMNPIMPPKPLLLRAKAWNDQHHHHMNDKINIQYHQLFYAFVQFPVKRQDAESMARLWVHFALPIYKEFYEAVVQSHGPVTQLNQQIENFYNQNADDFYNDQINSFIANTN